MVLRITVFITIGTHYKKSKQYHVNVLSA